jgi:hypothetical protein
MTITARFTERPLDETTLAEQAKAIRDDSSLRTAEISDVGLAMLATIVGKRLNKVHRAMIGEALRETLSGASAVGYAAEGDPFAQMYGEMFGPLFTCLEQPGSDFLVIRLAPTSSRARQRFADLLLTDRACGTVMLMECKGHCTDLDSVESDDNTLDLCRTLRRMRNDGRNQLENWPDLDVLARSDRRLRIRRRTGTPTAFFPRAERCVVATAVPDGRLKSARVECGRCDNRECTSCLFSPDPTLVTVLSSDRLTGSSRRGHIPGPGSTDSPMEFLDWYKVCERAIWAKAHGTFSNAYLSLVGSWLRPNRPSESRPQETPMLLALVMAALHAQVFVDFAMILQGEKSELMPDELRSSLTFMHEIQGEVARPRLRETSAEAFSRTFFGRKEEGESPKELAGNWLLQTGGQSVEVNVEATREGWLDMKVIPQTTTGTSATPDLSLGISELVSGGRFPPELVHGMFWPESVAWKSGQAGSRTFDLGMVLGGFPFPLYPFVDPLLLRDMHGCCPDCDHLARCLEHWWLAGPFPHHWFWRHHRHHLGTRRLALPEPMAFVTSDAKAVMQWPSYSRP